MKVLIVGSGGREHALLWKLQREAPDADFFFTGSNAGMQESAAPVALAATDVAGLVNFARAREIDLTVVGPEAALAAGITDAFVGAGLSIFGPRRAAAEIEVSKAFAKAFMQRHGIPTADFRTFSDFAAADAHLAAGAGPIVVKASGLMGGKGAVVCEDRAEARAVAAAMLRDGSYGEAGREIVVEEMLQGRELSVIALTDGQNFRLLAPARDHKRLLEGDAGPNTGGMGALAPVAEVPTSLLEQVAESIVEPVLRGLAAEDRTFRGALYAGLMLTEAGPRVVEFNARFGDPETQAVLPLLESSLLDLLLASAESAFESRPTAGPSSSSRVNGSSARSRRTARRRGGMATLEELEPRWRPGVACCVVVSAGGYPGEVRKGDTIELGDASSLAALGSGKDAGGAARREALVFHAGTARSGGRIVTAGGRVLGITGIGPDLEHARAAAYARIAAIEFPGMHYRRDIGAADVARRPWPEALLRA